MPNAITPKALLILRLSLALFLLPWVIEKFTAPEQTAKIFAHFYHIPLNITGSYIIGLAWALLLIAFTLGFKKRISYGLAAVFHGVTVVATIPQMLPFLESYNHLFVAAIPVLGGFVALYLMRDQDTIMVLDKRT